MDVLPMVLREDTLRRIFGEYLEMPGLRLTPAQAQRLFGLDGPTCAMLLDFLVEAGFLCRVGAGAYGRLTDGPVAHPPFEMIKARLETTRPARARKSA
ncbi:MAG TPA: hypothetical protein VLD67_02155 [Vicinamibacterales bacterium]|nr:hypothetical protein [Vicinamibacterales bacterium]